VFGYISDKFYLLFRSEIRVEMYMDANSSASLINIFAFSMSNKLNTTDGKLFISFHQFISVYTGNIFLENLL